MGHDENMVKSNLFYLLLSILRNKRLNDVHFRDFFMHHTYKFFEKKSIHRSLLSILLFRYMNRKVKFAFTEQVQTFHEMSVVQKFIKIYKMRYFYRSFALASLYSRPKWSHRNTILMST